MSDTTPRARRLAVGLTGPQLLEAIGQPRLWERLGASGAAFLVAGIDRLAASGPVATARPQADIDDSVAATYLASGEGAAAVLIAGAAHRDHPYNLARRVASADHLSGGRTGLLLGGRDLFAPPSELDLEAWSGARLGGGVPLAPETTRDAAQAISALWRSWPAASIVADREGGVYARAEQIVHINHHGRFDIAGPLTVPTTAQTAPVLAWYAADAEDAAAAHGVAELIVAAPRVRVAAEQVPVFTDVGVAANDSIADALRAAGAEDAVDVIVRTSDTTALGDLIALVDEARASRVFAPTPVAGTLRERLGIAAPDLEIVGATAAFPVVKALR